ncbi:MAG: hypothetical protein E7307_04965 [Butyrivibrio sp.]|nr:hypothetical protein [Butyrivibrio sp.]
MELDRESVAYYSARIEELIDGIDRGDFGRDEIPDNYRWMHLMSLFLLRESLEGGGDLFDQLYDVVTAAAVRRLQNKYKSGDKINVIFQSYSAAQWPAEGVYRLLDANDSFDVKVLVTPLDDRDENSCRDSYNKTLEWFKNSGHTVLEGMDPETGEFRSWEYFGNYPDIAFQLSSWFSSTPQSLWFASLPLHCLLAYIPYGIQFAENHQGTFAPEAVFNKEIFNLVWRIYCDSGSTLSGYSKYQFLGGRNAVFSGYAKMDYFYEEKKVTDEQIKSLWKIPEGKNPDEIKRIIIAPHYSVLHKGWLLFSTFRENAWFMLYLAKKYKDKVSFVLKPHPNLRYAAVAGKMFKDYESYDKYLEKWNSLPNARVVEESSYLELFSTSDAMMTDSVSFLGEYLYVNKPLLLLTRPEQGFLELGKKVTDSYYKAPGTDYEKIEEFLQNVVIEGNDTMSAQRESVFAKELDYVTYNGCKASEFVYGDIMKLLEAKS